MDQKQTESIETRQVDNQGESLVRRQEVVVNHGPSGLIIARRIVRYVISLIIALLAIRVVLQLLGANQGNEFVDFIYRVSEVFAAPFFGMFSYQPSYGSSTLEVGTVVGILVYALIGWGISAFTTLGSSRRTE